MTDLIARLEALREFVQATRSGQCKVLSQGTSCVCRLCTLDEALALLRAKANT